EQMTLRLRLRKNLKYSSYVAGRTVHHARALLPVLVEGIAWSQRPGKSHKPFLTFLLAANIFNFGLFIFFLLYNLYLGDRGLREDSLGLITAAMTAGTVTGSLAAAAFSHRFGLKRSLLAGCLATAAVSALRAVVMSKTALLISAFLGGLAWSVWIVALAP